jgi:hypothetical protein
MGRVYMEARNPVDPADPGKFREIDRVICVSKGEQLHWECAVKTASVSGPEFNGECSAANDGDAVEATADCAGEPKKKSKNKKARRKAQEEAKKEQEEASKLNEFTLSRKEGAACLRLRIDEQAVAAASTDVSSGSGILEFSPPDVIPLPGKEPSYQSHVRVADVPGLDGIESEGNKSAPKGLVATRHFSPGDVIFIEAPVLSDFEASYGGTSERLLRPRWEALSPELQSAVLDLHHEDTLNLQVTSLAAARGMNKGIKHDNFGDSDETFIRSKLDGFESDPVKKAIAVIDGNSFAGGRKRFRKRDQYGVGVKGFQTSEDEEVMLLFLLLSRANHSCHPNSQRMCMDDGRSRLVALRDINEGEG